MLAVSPNLCGSGASLSAPAAEFDVVHISANENAITVVKLGCFRNEAFRGFSHRGLALTKLSAVTGAFRKHENAALWLPEFSASNSDVSGLYQEVAIAVKRFPMVSVKFPRLALTEEVVVDLNEWRSAFV